MKVGINSSSMLTACTGRSLQGQVWAPAEWRNPMEKHAGLIPAHLHERTLGPIGTNF